MKTFRLARAVAVTAAATTMLSLSASVAHATTGEDTIGPSTPGTSFAALEHDAQANGSVPIMVATDDVPVGSALDPVALRLRHMRRRGLQAELAGDRTLLADNDMPVVALNATAAQLRRIQRSKNAIRVMRDREVHLESIIGRDRDPVDSVSGPKAAASSTSPSNAASGTTTNGTNNQLSTWWDWFRVGVDSLNKYGYTGAGQAVAVIDTGVDSTHPWLSGRVVSEACFAKNANGTGACPNGSTAQYGSGAGRPCTFSYDCAHGTHTAHTSGGYWGVASGARIIAVQIFHRNTADGSPTYFESDLTNAQGYVYGLRNSYRIAAVNMSIGGGGSRGYCDNLSVDGTTQSSYVTGWINALKSVGIASVVSSGNDDWYNGTRSPACITNAVSVGNTTIDAANTDAVYGYTKYGSNSDTTLDLLAPGTDICSAVPKYLDNDGNPDGVGCSWIGTSMAAPHVTGAIAVLRQYRPAATVDQMVSALARSGTAVYDSRNGITRTRINVWRALSYL